MIIIGEKINGSIPAVAEAIKNRDAELIKERARIQTEAGASFIDCCASVPAQEFADEIGADCFTVDAAAEAQAAKALVS